VEEAAGGEAYPWCGVRCSPQNANRLVRAHTPRRLGACEGDTLGARERAMLGAAMSTWRGGRGVLAARADRCCCGRRRLCCSYALSRPPSQRRDNSGWAWTATSSALGCRTAYATLTAGRSTRY
jgi:hypothetical protein